MKIVCVSDTHGATPFLPDSDLVFIAGDICPVISPINSSINLLYQRNWINKIFIPWVEAIKVPVCMTVGNHDLIFDKSPYLVPELPPNCHLLIDNMVTLNGLKIWGTPWQLPFGSGWSYNAEDDVIFRKVQFIPDYINVIISHGPPFGIGSVADEVIGKNGEIIYPERDIGSKAFADRIKDLNELKLVVCGHCHEGFGIYSLNNCVVVNASYMINQGHNRHNDPVVIEI